MLPRPRSTFKAKSEPTQILEPNIFAREVGDSVENRYFYLGTPQRPLRDHFWSPREPSALPWELSLAPHLPATRISQAASFSQCVTDDRQCSIDAWSPVASAPSYYGYSPWTRLPRSRLQNHRVSRQPLNHATSPCVYVVSRRRSSRLSLRSARTSRRPSSRSHRPHPP